MQSEPELIETAAIWMALIHNLRASLLSTYVLLVQSLAKGRDI